MSSVARMLFSNWPLKLTALGLAVPVAAQNPDDEDKPDDIVAKMVEGRLRKYYEEVCLLDQTFVIDGEGGLVEVEKFAQAIRGNSRANLAARTTLFPGDPERAPSSTPTSPRSRRTGDCPTR